MGFDASAHKNEVSSALLIVDDEPPARRKLARMIKQLRPESHVLMANDCDSALECLKHTQCLGVFLDIHMPGQSGMILARQLRHGPPVVFVTAYRDFAIEAFEVQAVDYIVKPVVEARLADALQRIGQFERIPTETIRCADGVRFIQHDNIICISGQRDYAEVWLDDGTSELSDITMYSWEERLSDSFIRVHRSTLVRRSAIEAIRRTQTGSYLVEVCGVDKFFKINRNTARQLSKSMNDLIVK